MQDQSCFPLEESRTQKIDNLLRITPRQTFSLEIEIQKMHFNYNGSLAKSYKQLSRKFQTFPPCKTTA